MDRAEAIYRLRVMVVEADTKADIQALDLAIEALVLQDKYVKALERMIEGAKEINRFLEEAAKKSDEKHQLKHQLSEETSTISEKESLEDDLFNKSFWRMGMHDTAVRPCTMADTSTNEGDAESATTTDCISRQQAIEAIECVDWYHVNSKGELVHGSTSDEESWYKAEDIYKAIESLPSVVPDFETFCGVPIKEAIEVLEKYGHSPSGTPTVSDDCISRDYMLKLPEELKGWMPNDKNQELWEKIKDAPSVTPTNKVQQADTLIIASALRYFAQDSERNISDRERAEELRKQVLAYGASMCTPVTPTERTGEWIDNAPEGQGIDPPYICSMQSEDERIENMSEELNCMNCSIGDFKHELCDCDNGFCKEFKSIGTQEDFFNAVIQRIRPQGGWIPVSERLPEGYAQYLCYCEGGDCYVYWLENKPWAEETVEREEIIAWQPLPEPYKGGDTE